MAESEVPELDHFSGSWIVTRKTDGSVIGEFYNRNIVSQFNPNAYLIETALQYLYRINREQKTVNSQEATI